ncbi:MAG: transmembrane 9 family protein [Akkermansiaceae bacterium]|nr:transmembrane 9 family protein [Akkermansiaceae bacterium]
MQLADEEQADVKALQAQPGDVFRTPAASQLLSVLFGAGAHMLCSAVGLLVLFRVGLFSPERRELWMPGSVLMYLLLSPTAGYFSVLLWRHLRRDDTVDGVGVAVKAVLLFPGALLVLMMHEQHA